MAQAAVINPLVASGRRARTGLFKRNSVLPGFGLTMGFSLMYLSLLVLLPLSALVIRALELSWPELWAVPPMRARWPRTESPSALP